MHDRGLDSLHEVDDARVGDVGLREVGRPLCRGEVGADERVQAGGRDVRICLAKAELAPVRVPAAAPAGPITRECHVFVPAQTGIPFSE